MDYEAALNQALDLLADGEDRKADALMQSGVKHAKANLVGSDADLDRYYYWAGSSPPWRSMSRPFSSSKRPWASTRPTRDPGGKLPRQSSRNDLELPFGAERLLEAHLGLPEVYSKDLGRLPFVRDLNPLC